LNKPSADIIAQKKERKISASHTSVMAYGFAVEGRDKRKEELKLLWELEDSPTKKKDRKQTLMDFLQSAPPSSVIIYTSGNI
jgi:hypothetical protein